MFNCSYSLRHFYPIALGLVFISLAGCAEDRGLVPVTGKITFQGDVMPGNGTIRFLPVSVDEGFPMRPGHANFDVDGVFAARSFMPGDGLYPGTYKVSVTCWEIPPVMGGPPPVSYLHARFKNPHQSELELTVGAGFRSVEFNLDVGPPDG